VSTRHINPEGLHRNPAFSQAVVVEQPSKTIYVGGQNGVDADARSSARRSASRPARRCATSRHPGKRGSEPGRHRALVHRGGGRHSLGEGFAAFQQAWNPADPPPAITVHVVAGLGPGFLVEIDAVAVV